MLALAGLNLSNFTKYDVAEGNENQLSPRIGVEGIFHLNQNTDVGIGLIYSTQDSNSQALSGSSFYNEGKFVDEFSDVTMVSNYILLPVTLKFKLANKF